MLSALPKAGPVTDIEGLTESQKQTLRDLGYLEDG